MSKSKFLNSLYSKLSKHSNYQVLPSALKSILATERIVVKSRYEYERLEFLKKSLDVNGKLILDVGGNTGFFSFELLDAGAKNIIYIEGNKIHADFVLEASKILKKNITVNNDYLNFEENIKEAPFDIVLLLNVIHHIGDDFGCKKLSAKSVKIKMAECINYFHDKTDYLVLQMGFCWQGDTTKPLFKNGTKGEMIKFVEKAIKGKWKILFIGVPEIEGSNVVYKELNDNNILRIEKLGEFLNRPIFILASISRV